MAIIYSIMNMTNGKRYIGQTSRSVVKRLEEHVRYNDYLLGKALKKYGEENFCYQTWEVPDDSIDEAERYFIKRYDTLRYNGYNIHEGGNVPPNHKGKKRSKTTRNKISESLKGRKLSDAHIKNMSESLKGKYLGSSRYNARAIILIHQDGTEEKFDCINDACRKYNLKDSHISKVCKGDRKIHKGFKANYV